MKIQTFFNQETFDISQNSPEGKPEKIQWSEKGGPCNEYYECIFPGVFLSLCEVEIDVIKFDYRDIFTQWFDIYENRH